MYVKAPTILASSGSTVLSRGKTGVAIDSSSNPVGLSGGAVGMVAIFTNSDISGVLKIQVNGGDGGVGAFSNCGGAPGGGGYIFFASTQIPANTIQGG